MTVQLQTVPTHFAAQVWPQVEDFIARSEKHSGGDYTMDQIRMYVNLGLWWLVVGTTC